MEDYPLYKWVQHDTWTAVNDCISIIIDRVMCDFGVINLSHGNGCCDGSQAMFESLHISPYSLGNLNVVKLSTFISWGTFNLSVKAFSKQTLLPPLNASTTRSAVGWFGALVKWLSHKAVNLVSRVQFSYAPPFNK